MADYFCKYCGQKFNSVSAMTTSNCPRHPNGPHRGKHAPYEGSLKSEYVCKYCGQKFHTISAMTTMKCYRHPDGPMKGPHSPML